MSFKTAFCRTAAVLCIGCLPGGMLGAAEAAVPTATAEAPAAKAATAKAASAKAATAKAPAAEVSAPAVLLPGPHLILPAYGAREVWRRAVTTDGSSVSDRLAAAKAALAVPMEPFSRTFYLDFRTNGDRYRFQNHNARRRRHLEDLFLGEMVEGMGRFIPAIARDMETLCSDPSWVLPAHDGSLRTLEGRQMTIDLTSSHRGWYLAEMASVLGDRLPKATRDLVWETLRRRIYEPYVNQAIRSRRCHWIHVTSNWNPVCHAGVVGTVLAMPTLTDAERTAVVRAALVNVRPYFRSFTSDGWSTEGMGYWDYGFSSFVNLSELIRRATGGTTDILRQWPKARLCALTPARCRLTGDLYPSVCDGAAEVRPNPMLCAWLRQYFNEPDPRITFPATRRHRFPDSYLLHEQPSSVTVPAKVPDLPTVTWLPGTQLMIGRSPKKDAAAWMIGGHNGVPHNHNDVGVYGYTMGNTPMVGDLGGEVYTSRTFSSGRYRSCLLNSFGHAVPQPNSAWQQEGGQYRATLLDCTPEGDRPKLKLDLLRAYRQTGKDRLVKLEREGTWSVADAVLTVTDTFAYASAPAPFETVVTTWGTARKVDENTVRITMEGKELLCTVEASGPIEITETILAGKGLPCGDFIERRNPFGLARPSGRRFAEATARRLGIRLKEPAQQGFIRLTYRPGTAHR